MGSAERGDPEPLAPGITKRVSAILESVRREAETMLDEAQVEAGRTLSHPDQRGRAEDRRRLGEISGELIERAEAILAASRVDEAEILGESFAELARTLAAAADELGRDLVAASESELRARGTAPGLDAEALEARVRYAAVEMAALGCTRAQVESYLRGFLAVGDPGEVLDQIYGIASDAGAQAPWAVGRA